MTYGQMLFHHGGKISNNKKAAAFFVVFFSLQASAPVIVTDDFQRWGFLPDFCCTLLFSSHSKGFIAEGLYTTQSVYYTGKFWIW